MDKGLWPRARREADRKGSSAVLSMPAVPKKYCADSPHSSCSQMLLSGSLLLAQTNQNKKPRAKESFFTFKKDEYIFVLCVLSVLSVCASVLAMPAISPTP